MPLEHTIAVEFVSVAADIIGATKGGLTGSEIVQVTAGVAYDLGVSIPHGSVPFAAFNKRTAVYENVMAFQGKDRFAVIRALCERLEQREPLSANQQPFRDLRVKLFTRYGHLADSELHEINPAVIEETRHWLESAPDALELYNHALAKHQTGAFERNALDDLRLSLELLLRRALRNDKSLENQVADVGKLIKEAGGSPELANMFVKLLDYYSKYQNSYVKHDAAVNATEMDFMFEITSAFMKQVLRVSRA